MHTLGVFDYTHARVLYNTEQYNDCVAVCRNAACQQRPRLQLLPPQHCTSNTTGAATNARGDPKAQYLLALCYYHGHGVAKDGEQTVQLAALSAAQNDPLGLYLLGSCYEEGLCASKAGVCAEATRLHEAAALYRRSAAHGCAEGQHALAMLLPQLQPQLRENDQNTVHLAMMAAHQGLGVAMSYPAFNAADVCSQLRWGFKAATAAQDQISTAHRQGSIRCCAALAHELTHPQASPDRHNEFINSIKACVQEEVHAARADAAHGTTLAALLNSARLSGPTTAATATPTATACDLTLLAGTQPFPCHRIVLMAASAFFRTLFSGDFAESGVVPQVVELRRDCEPAVVGRVLTYVYTGTIAFESPADAADVLKTSQFYQIDNLTEACSTYLLPRVGAYNSVLVEAVAQGPLCETLKCKARACTAQNLVLASGTELFLASGFDAVKALLSDEDVHRQAGSDDALLKAALQWANHDSQRRGGDLLKLLDCVRLPGISTQCFATAVRTRIVTDNVPVLLKLTHGFTHRANAPVIVRRTV